MLDISTLLPKASHAAVANQGQPVIIKADDLPNEEVLSTFKVKSQPSLSVLAMEGKWALVNVSNNDDDEPINLPAGTFIAGFGRGGFRNLPGDRDPASENGHYLYELKDSNDAIIFNNNYTTIGAIHVAEAQRQPDIGVAYHEMRETGLVDRKFDLALTEKVVFVPRKSAAASSGSPEGGEPEAEAITSCWGESHLHHLQVIEFLCYKPQAVLHKGICLAEADLLLDLNFPCEILPCEPSAMMCQTIKNGYLFILLVALLRNQALLLKLLQT